MVKRYTLSFLLLVSMLSACTTDKGVPAYIRVNAISVSTEPITQGTNSSNVTDAWIYVDDNLVGAFELPCDVPVLATGNRKISIGAGVKINGISSLRAPYPFYQFYETNAELVAGESVDIQPQVSYFDSLQFAFLANFDDISGSKLEASGATDTTIGITNNPAKVFEGNGSMIAQLNRDSGFVEFQFVETINLPKQGTVVYLEFDYKNTHVLSVGLKSYYALAGTQSTELINLNKTDEWKKVYISMTRAVSEQLNASNYRVYFYSLKSAGSEPLEILIDNMKIIY
jgi:hypothetical protein